MVSLRPFQKEFLKHVFQPGIDICGLSLPRGNGKSFLAAHVIQRCLTPGDPWFMNGREVVQCAGSIEQARMVYGFVREALEPTGEYCFIDSTTRLGITHLESNTKLRILSSNGKTAMGLVRVGLAVCDEPGSWELAGGLLMWDALTGALGKPGSPLQIVVIGTLAPAALAAGHWWWDMVHDGSHHSTYIQALQGKRETWDQWPTIRKANPLTAISADFRAKLLEERDAARLDSRLRARFMSYRLNQPSADESEVLLTVDDWEAVTARDVPDRKGRPVVGADLGGGRAWSAAVGMWGNGLTEALAVAPGVPSLGEQERRDRVPAGTYQKLYDMGQLTLAEGLKVPPPAMLWSMIQERWGKPTLICMDRFRLSEMEDATNGKVRLEPRVSRWSEASSDIRSLRRMCKDGPLAVHPDSRTLMATSLSVTRVKNDDQGSTRLVKKDASNNTARDDVSAAAVLCAGALDRHPKPRSVRFLGFAE